MKTYQYSFGGQTFSITLNAAGQVTEATSNGQTVALDDTQMAHIAACIALALAEDEATFVHDDEQATSITIDRKPTPWNLPSRQFRALTKK